MRVEFTRDEAARIMAHHYAQQAIRADIERLQQRFNGHADALAAIEREVRVRVPDLPDTPMALWQLQIDGVALTGGAEVREGD